jgi:hypothetical protein
MAQKITITNLCDPHADDTTEADEQVQFSLDGTGYEIDMCSNHAKDMREKVAPYLAHARRAGAVRHNSGGRRPRNRASGTAIRAWAKSQGMSVAERGKIPAAIVTEYELAHQPGSVQLAPEIPPAAKAAPVVVADPPAEKPKTAARRARGSAASSATGKAKTASPTGRARRGRAAASQGA